MSEELVEKIAGAIHAYQLSGAHLIAAAPDLYAALAAEVAQRAPKDGLPEYQCSNGYSIGDPECDCADCRRHRASVAALAKARGETP